MNRAMNAFKTIIRMGIIDFFHDEKIDDSLGLLHVKHIRMISLPFSFVDLFLINFASASHLVHHIVWLNFPFCSICLGAGKFDLMTKYGKRFVTSGVKLRQTSFDMWMEFAAKKGMRQLSLILQLHIFLIPAHFLTLLITIHWILFFMLHHSLSWSDGFHNPLKQMLWYLNSFYLAGDVESLWKVEKWRSKDMKKHSLSTGFSCAKVMQLLPVIGLKCHLSVENFHHFDLALSWK